MLACSHMPSNALRPIHIPLFSLSLSLSLSLFLSCPHLAPYLTLRQRALTFRFALFAELARLGRLQAHTLLFSDDYLDQVRNDRAAAVLIIRYHNDELVFLIHLIVVDGWTM